MALLLIGVEVNNTTRTTWARLGGWVGGFARRRLRAQDCGKHPHLTPAFNPSFFCTACLSADCSLRRARNEKSARSGQDKNDHQKNRRRERQWHKKKTKDYEKPEEKKGSDYGTRTTPTTTTKKQPMRKATPMVLKLDTSTSPQKRGNADGTETKKDNQYGRTATPTVPLEHERSVASAATRGSKEREV